MTKISLCVYLLSEAIENPDEALREPEVLLRRDFTVDDTPGVFFVKPQSSSPPEWLAFANEKANGLLDGFEVASASAVAVLRVSDRFFALTFGSGRSLLDAGAYERNFGLKVTVNAVDSQRMRVIDAQNLNVNPLNQRRKTTKSTSIIDFSVDTERDLLLAAQGEASDETLFGRSIAGRDSFRFKRAIEWGDVPGVLTNLLELSRSEVYKDSFSWIDHIVEVKSPVEINRLDNALVSAINDDRQNDGLALAVPEVLDWQEVDFFRYQKAQTGEKCDDIDWDSYSRTLHPDKDVSLELLKKQTIYCYKDGDSTPYRHWKVYRCIYFELSQHNEVHILNNGAWYKVDQDYVRSTNEAVDRIQTSEFSFPTFKVEEDEDAYIARICNLPSQPCLMHKRFIHHGGGSSKLEFCDVATLDKQFIHIKVYGSGGVSASLNHLFAQGLNPARLFTSDQSFREKANAYLPEQLKFNPLQQRPKTHEYTVVFAIAGSPKQRNSELPLLSRITLRNTATLLQDLGMQIATKHIPVGDGS